MFNNFYSLLNVSTRSFFAASRAGISPDISVSTILTRAIMNAVGIVSFAIVVMPNSESTARFTKPQIP